jgi:hypothetical protein
MSSSHSQVIATLTKYQSESSRLAVIKVLTALHGNASWEIRYSALGTCGVIDLCLVLCFDLIVGLLVCWFVSLLCLLIVPLALPCLPLVCVKYLVAAWQGEPFIAQAVDALFPTLMAALADAEDDIR